MFKIGLETESCHLSMQNGRMDIFQFIDFAHEVGYEAVMINIVEKKNLPLGALGSDDIAHLMAVRDKLAQYNMLVELDTRGTSYHHLATVLNVAHILGCPVVRTFITATSGYGHGTLVCAYTPEDLEQARCDVVAILPLLQKHRIRLAFENHEVETIDELSAFIDQVNSPWVGLHMDIGNTIPAWEDPVEGCKRAGRRVFATHIKDCYVSQRDGVYYSTGAALGQGSIDVAHCCEILLDNAPIEALYLEMSHPYSTTFKRSPGAGGVSQVGEGTFVLKPLPSVFGSMAPETYYMYDGDQLEALIDKQLEDVKISFAYLAAFRQQYNQEKERNTLS